MKLLIVDDELSSITAVSNMIDKEKLNIEECYTAENAREAKKYLTEEEIDIVLCDIEMPQESGLELLKWIGKQQIAVEFIIMTCYAEFEYAKKAVSLGSHAYLLKPLDGDELEHELTEAIRHKTQKDQMKQYSSSWLQNQNVFQEKFWMKLFRGEISSDKSSIEQWIRANQIAINLEWTYCPVLFVIRKWGSDISPDDYNLYRFALRNILDELYSEESRIPLRDIIPFGSDIQLAVAGYASSLGNMPELCTSICSKYLQTVKEFIDVSINCYIGTEVALWDVANEIENLHQMDYSNLWKEGVYRNRGGSELNAKGAPADETAEFLRWLELLMDGDYTKAEHKMINYLDFKAKTLIANRKWLVLFQRQYMIMLSTFASQRKLFLNQIILSDEAAVLLSDADKSMEDLKDWIRYSLKAVMNLDKKETNIKDPVECTKRFVEEHLSDELDMEIISQNVHLNPDYLTRIFRKATGESVNKYIVNQRINKAKQLLKRTNHPISDVAFQVGYYNYTSFHRIFSKNVGVSPQSYRQNNRTD